jgi:Fe-S cluster biogenesis protein NfuA/nitrite reductase/ring-hydroxylating ferredoxin subunit
MDGVQASERVARVESLLEEVDALADARARETATELVAALLDLYGEGLERIVAEVSASDHDGALAASLGADELVSHLLLLHGLHPVALETRVRAALEEVRPYLQSHGGNVELLEVADGVARLRLEGSCSGCPSSTMTLKLAIEDAIRKAAPDVEEIEAEGAVAPAAPPATGLKLDIAISPGRALPMAGDASPPPAGDSWTMAGGLPELGRGSPVVKSIGGEPVLFLDLDGAKYAYRPDCPACGESLAGAALRLTELECASCAKRYDALRAGRCLDAPQLHLEPVPLLVDDAGLIRVALGVAA